MPDPREQSEAVARWCGWKPTGSYSQPWRNPKGRMVYRVPPYADSLDAMREVEDEIERRGLQDSYAGWLCRVLFGEKEPGSDATWIVATATALQRLQAAARVIEEVGNAG